MELVETPAFTRQVAARMDEAEYRLLQLYLISHPDAGALIPGSGGLRKLRWRLPGRGKRGGARVIYFWDVRHDRIYLVFMYPKNVRDEPTARELITLRRLIDDA